ncbi:hypothetical protein EYR38_004944 [Pleurotus pulmonarius]|nr:hypothetical protein EYR38_004944 [Pleurotus pulmonarius]
MPPGDARKSCSSCLHEKRDGRSAHSRAKKLKTNKCTKCPNDLDPHPSEAKYRRCRRCREETMRTQRRQGVKPKTGQDETCTLCGGVMIDARFESCEACRFGPRAITLSGRRCKDQMSPTTSYQDATGACAAAAGVSGSIATPYVYPDLPPLPTTLYTTSRSSPSQTHDYNTPSNASGSNLSLTPLSFAGSLSSESPYTSWNGTPYSADGSQVPLPPPDSPLGLRLSSIRTRTISGSGRVYGTNSNTYPQPASAPTYLHPLPCDSEPDPSAFNYAADSRLGPISFSTPLRSIALPDDADSQYINYDYDPANTIASIATCYQPGSSPADVLNPIYHEQPVLLQGDPVVYHKDHATEMEGVHSPSQATSISEVDNPKGTSYVSGQSCSAAAS